MSIKLALLKSGETVISDAKELVSEEKVCGYLLKNPHVLDVATTILLTNDSSNKSDEVNISFTPWIPLSIDKEFLVTLDWVVTISEPLPKIKKLYEEKINV